MEERRIKLRRHIQAARAWLLQADKSLERENDVQGDLKLMLAKAELAQARGSHRSLVKKIFPPLTALMIAGAVAFGNQSAGLEETPAVSMVETQSENGLLLLDDTPTVQPDIVVELPTVESEPMAELAVEPVYESTVEECEFEEVSSTEEIPSTYSVSDYSTEVSPSDGCVEYCEPRVERVSYEPAYDSSSTAVPNEDIQQLMLDAGQILRAK